MNQHHHCTTSESSTDFAKLITNKAAFIKAPPPKIHHMQHLHNKVKIKQNHCITTTTITRLLMYNCIAFLTPMM